MASSLKAAANSQSATLQGDLMHASWAVFYFVASGFIASCSQPRPPKGHAPQEPSPDPRAARSSSDAAAGEAPRAGVGSTCPAEDDITAEGCARGLVCLPIAGGFCSSRCPCGDQAVCVETTRRGEFCAPPCGAEGRCREGLVCDTAWGACVPDRFGRRARRSAAGRVRPKRPLARRAQSRPSGAGDSFKWSPSLPSMLSGMSSSYSSVAICRSAPTRSWPRKSSPTAESPARLSSRPAWRTISTPG